MTLTSRLSPRRLLVAALVATAVLPLCGVPAASADDGDIVVGELVQAWPEYRDSAAVAEPLSWIEPAEGDAVRVPTADVAHLERGATLEVTLGREVADGAAADGLEPARDVLSAEVVAAGPSEPPVAAALPPGSVRHHVTVVMVIPAGGTRDATSLADVVTTVNDPVATFWMQQTTWSIAIGVDAQVDWPSVPYTASCADPTALWAEAQAKSGFVPGPGQYLLLYVPPGSPGCADELAEIGENPWAGGRVYVTDASATSIAHGLGHNFGLGHASTQRCDASVETGSCRIVDGGDHYEVMGTPWGQMGSLSAAQKAAMGLVPMDPAVVMRATDARNQFELVPAAPATRGLKLIGPSGNVYWVEYRTPVGQDAWLGDPALNPAGLESGVFVRREPREQDPTYGDDATLLLDGTPSSAADWADDQQVAFPVGVPVRLDGGAFTVTVRSLGAFAEVQIEPVSGDTACATRPSVSMAGVSLLTWRGTTGALVIGLDRALWYRPIDGDSTSWRSLAGGALYGPASVAAGSTAYVFVVGLNGALFYRADDGSGWGPWTTLGGYLTASPAAASLEDGHVRVFGRGLDGQLWSRELLNGSWSGWVSHGGYLTSPPMATADTVSGRLEVQVRGLDGRVYAQALPAGSGAMPYQRTGVAACSAFALDAVRSGSDPTRGAFLDRWGAPFVHRAGFSMLLGGWLTSTPAVEYRTGDDWVLVGRGLDGALWLHENRAPSTRVWRSLGGYVLN